MSALVFTRREARARHLVPGRSRRDAPHRDPNLFEILVGVTVFVVFAAACLYVIAAIGS